MGLLIAGARSTGTIGRYFYAALSPGDTDEYRKASWLITFIGCHPTWRDAALKEIRQLVDTHAPQPPHAPVNPGNLASSAPRPSDALVGIPLSAWENEMPVADALIKETLRIAQPHVAMRRNVGPDPVFIDGKIVPPGAFVIYPFSDVHLNEDLYPDPWRFDPGRPAPKEANEFSYIGWGGGTSHFFNATRCSALTTLTRL